MRKSLVLAVFALALSAVKTYAFTRESVRIEPMTSPYGLSADCTLAAFNMCSGWIWAFDDVEGAVWGAVLDPDDCTGGCSGGGCVTEITLYSRCNSVPGRFGGLGLSSVDAANCLVASLYESGPLTVTHCVIGDRWTTFPVPDIALNGNPFAVTVTWGPGTAGTSNPRFGSDNGITNLYCSQGGWSFPSCAGTTLSCPGWTIPPQNTFIYVTDVDADGDLDDLCELYGSPDPLSFPYFYPYGYLPNRLLVSVGLDCGSDCWSPTAVEPSSWGRLKALYD